MYLNALNQIQSNQSFCGSIKIKNIKKMPENMQKAIMSAPFVKTMAEDNDVVVRVMRKKPGEFDSAHRDSKYIYNLLFSVLKANSCVDKVLDFLHLGQCYRFAHNFHDEKGIIRRLNDKKRTEFFVNQFKYFI